MIIIYKKLRKFENNTKNLKSKLTKTNKSHMYMNHLVFTFKNINFRVRILDKKNNRKVKKEHLQNDLYLRY